MFADIALNTPLDTLFTYRVPDNFTATIRRGSRVLVPFRHRHAVGICLSFQDKYDEKKSGVPEKNIKSIIDADAIPFLDESYLKWVEFAAEHYFYPVGQVLAQTLPEAWLDPKDFHLSRKKRTHEKLTRDFTGVKDPATITLTTAQRSVVEQAAQNLDEFYPALVHGITGSGKTEIYIDLIKKILQKGKSALYLVPEIGLTPQTLARLENHFSETLEVIHSGLTPNRKIKAWNAARGDRPVVLVGTRSALFAPFKRLGMIVVDEEQDSSYKQEDRFRYHARDLAVARAHMLKIPVIMGSATPSLETYHLARQGKYRYFELAERPGNIRPPQIEIIDMAREKRQSGLPLNVARPVIDALRETLASGAQAIVFVGQRGYAQNAFCTACAKIETCPNCSVGLKYHVGENVLKCHYCALAKKFDEICSACAAKSLTLIGFGIQSVEEELRIAVPEAKLARVDSDSLSTAKKLEEILVDFAAGKLNLIVGTQMMSKGHDFPNVRFVGIVGLDAHMGLPDFRAAERSFQQLVQVAGRAGRRGEASRVMVQSFIPTHASLVHGVTHDYNAFAARELAERETLGYPPFSRLVQIRLISPREAVLRDFVTRTKAAIVSMTQNLARQKVKILGPSEMPLAKLRGNYRQHLILKIPRSLKIRDVVQYVLETLERLNEEGVQIQIDVDPMGLM